MLATKNQNQGLTLGLSLLGMLLCLAACSRTGPGTLLAGKKLLEAGRNEQAIIALQRATQASPTNAAAWNYLGVAYQQAGQWTNALDAYGRALRLDRDMIDVRFNLGCLWLEQQRWTEAKSELTAYLLHRAEDGEGWAKLGVAQHQLREAAAAEKSFQAAIRLQATNAQAWNGLGLLQAQRSHWRNATESFRTALKLAPQSRAVLLNLAVAEQEQGNEAAAVALYRRYLDATPRPANWEAVAAVVAALTSEPGRIPPPEQRGPPTNAAPVTNVSSRAVAATAKKSQPALQSPAGDGIKSGPPPSGAGGVDSRPSTSPAPARGATKLVSRPATPGLPPTNPSAAALALQEGQQAQRDRRLTAAVQAYRRAITLSPDMFEAHYCLGLAAYELRDFSAAAQAWATALRLRADSADTRYNYALALRAEAKYAQAITELEQLVKLHPDEARGHLMLGILYSERIIDVPRARLHFNRVLQLDPQNSQAPAIRSWLATHPG